MGWELTVFEGEPSYLDLAAGLKTNKVVQTIEFFPEEGKYHLIGHRECKVNQTPEETNLTGTGCPECGRPLTLGVLHRVQELGSGTQPIEEDKRPYIKLVPLMELLAHSMDRRREAKSVGQAYQRICSELGGEVQVLIQARFEDLKQVGGEDLAAAVTKVKTGEVEIVAGFDGRYGPPGTLIGYLLALPVSIGASKAKVRASKITGS